MEAGCPSCCQAARLLRATARFPVVAALHILFALAAACGRGESIPRDDTSYLVYPGREIQPALEAAAADPARKIVKVHAGTYRPQRPGQAMIWFNARHDGITLEAAGESRVDRGKPPISPTPRPKLSPRSSTTSSTSATGFRRTRSCGDSRSPGPTTSSPTWRNRKISSPTARTRSGRRGCSSTPTGAASRFSAAPIRPSTGSWCATTTPVPVAAGCR